ncbi:MAG: phosphatase PAP2 family protein [Proteobacteria bacterium]|nr:phosphatase PAP2 family protein [Pseudomonadota bacterium]
MRTLKTCFAAFMLLIADAANAATEVNPYADATAIDLLHILPPPPADDSAQTLAELGEILTIQIARTPAMAERARADSEESIWRFADVLGEKFTAQNLPRLAALSARLIKTEDVIVKPAKKGFNRPRPYVLSKLVEPLRAGTSMSTSGSWPSGHTTLGTLMGIVLSNMVPEKKAELMQRAWEYGNNRIVAGVHYRSDVEMGRIAGSVIAASLARRPDFEADFATAQKELRAVLGLAPLH